MSEEEKKLFEAIKYKNKHLFLVKVDADFLINLIENQQKELDNLKEIEKSHKEENGKLRVELEQEKSKIEALEKQHEYDMEMIDEVKGQANEWINLLEQEKEKNKKIENADLTTVYMSGFYDGEKKWKDKIKEKIDLFKNRLDDENGVKTINYHLYNILIEVFSSLLEEK